MKTHYNPQFCNSQNAISYTPVERQIYEDLEKAQDQSSHIEKKNVTLQIR